MQYPSAGTTPFGVLTAVVAPAILTNASSILALGTGNRLARVVDRTRVVAARVAEFEPDTAEHRAWTAQLVPLQVRAQLLVRTLRFSYAALGLFAASALISVAGSIAGYYGQELLFEAAAGRGIASGTSAVVSLSFGCVLMVRETKLAVQNLAEEARIGAG